LRPKLIKNQTRLHELFIFFSVLGGMSVFGLLGIVLGPVVLAITLGLLDTLRHGEEEVIDNSSMDYSESQSRFVPRVSHSNWSRNEIEARRASS